MTGFFGVSLIVGGTGTDEPGPPLSRLACSPIDAAESRD